MKQEPVPVVQKEEQTKVDRGWMSSENTFREQVMDMRLFMCKHQQELKGEADYENTIETLKKVYEQCFFNKDVYQLIAEDEIYKAVRRIMVETEMFGIENYRLEYEQLIGRIIAKETTELGIAFRHVSWAMKHYSRFFNTEDFKKLFIAVLKIYEPYFKVSVKEQRAWDLIGSQKEIAERCLMSISKTLESWGYYDAFWSKYKKVFNYNMTQEERWLLKYNEVVSFIESNNRNPSRHRIEEHDYLNWLKANRKVMNAGKMKLERVEKFKKLLEMTEQYRRKNQYE